MFSKSSCCFGLRGGDGGGTFLEPHQTWVYEVQSLYVMKSVLNMSEASVRTSLERICMYIFKAQPTNQVLCFF